jgi:hypothetical protein
MPDEPKTVTVDGPDTRAAPEVQVPRVFSWNECEEMRKENERLREHCADLAAQLQAVKDEDAIAEVIADPMTAGDRATKAERLSAMRRHAKIVGNISRDDANTLIRAIGRQRGRIEDLRGLVAALRADADAVRAAAIYNHHPDTYTVPREAFDALMARKEGTDNG